MPRIQRWLEVPMLVPGAVWLVLLVMEPTRGLSPFAEHVGTAVWLVFIADCARRYAGEYDAQGDPALRDELRRARAQPGIEQE